MGGTGWPLGGMRATGAAVFGMTPERRGDGGDGFGGTGLGGFGPGGVGPGGLTGKWFLSVYDEKCVLSGKGVFNANAPQTWQQYLRD